MQYRVHPDGTNSTSNLPYTKTQIPECPLRPHRTENLPGSAMPKLAEPTFSFNSFTIEQARSSHVDSELLHVVRWKPHFAFSLERLPLKALTLTGWRIDRGCRKGIACRPRGWRIARFPIGNPIGTFSQLSPGAPTRTGAFAAWSTSIVWDSAAAVNIRRT
jgi:hypothetical protein